MERAHRTTISRIKSGTSQIYLRHDLSIYTTQQDAFLHERPEDHPFSKSVNKGDACVAKPYIGPVMMTYLARKKKHSIHVRDRNEFCNEQESETQVEVVSHSVATYMVISQRIIKQTYRVRGERLLSYLS